MKYKFVSGRLTNHQDLIYRVEDSAWIPMNEANTDYQKYLAWVAEGNTAEEWQPDGE